MGCFTSCCGPDIECCCPRARRSKGGFCCFECSTGSGDEKRGKGCLNCSMPNTCTEYPCLPFKPEVWCCVHTWGAPSNYTRRTLASIFILPWALAIGIMFTAEFLAYAGIISAITVVTVIVVVVGAIIAAIVLTLFVILLLLFGVCLCMILAAASMEE